MAISYISLAGFPERVAGLKNRFARAEVDVRN